MVTVAEEEAFVAVAYDSKLPTVCSNCFTVKGKMDQIELKRCSKCQTIYYCSKKCQEEDWKYHKEECRGIIQFLILRLAMEEVRLLSRMIMRVKRGDVPVAFNGRTFDDMMDHKDELIKQRGNHNVYAQVASFLGHDNTPSFEEFLPLYGKRLVNSFGITSSQLFTPGYIGVGIYIGIAAHNHSCRPTAQPYFNGSKILLRVDDPNAVYSTDLTISYVPTTRTRESRQQELRSKYYFDCDCERCMDEETALLELSGKSTCCPTEGAVLPVDKKFQFTGYWQEPLVCTNCGKKADITLEQINAANKKLALICKDTIGARDAAKTKEAVDELVAQLEDAERFLSPYNLNLIRFAGVVQSAYSCVYEDPTHTVKYSSAEKKALEKYSLFNTTEYMTHVITQLRVEMLVASRNPSKEAFDKLETSFEKTLDLVKETYGTDHPLYKDVMLNFNVAKSHYHIWTVRYEQEKRKVKAKERLLAMF